MVTDIRDRLEQLVKQKAVVTIYIDDKNSRNGEIGMIRIGDQIAYAIGVPDQPFPFTAAAIARIENDKLYMQPALSDEETTRRKRWLNSQRSIDDL